MKKISWNDYRKAVSDPDPYAMGEYRSDWAGLDDEEREVIKDIKDLFKDIKKQNDRLKIGDLVNAFFKDWHPKSEGIEGLLPNFSKYYNKTLKPTAPGKWSKTEILNILEKDVKKIEKDEKEYIEKQKKKEEERKKWENHPLNIFKAD